MLKPIILVLLTLTTIQGSAQALEYSKVFQVDSTISKDQLFVRARAWFVDYYKNASAVLQVSDKENGELLGAPQFTFDYNIFLSAFSAQITYRVSVKIKQCRYKVTIYQFNNDQTIQVAGSHRLKGYGQLKTTYYQYLTGNGAPMNEKKYRLLLDRTDQMAKNIFSSLAIKMNEPALQEDDW